LSFVFAVERFELREGAFQVGQEGAGVFHILNWVRY
jgi:hypothetical protein